MRSERTAYTPFVEPDSHKEQSEPRHKRRETKAQDVAACQTTKADRQPPYSDIHRAAALQVIGENSEIEKVLREIGDKDAKLEDGSTTEACNREQEPLPSPAPLRATENEGASEPSSPTDLLMRVPASQTQAGA